MLVNKTHNSFVFQTQNLILCYAPDEKSVLNEDDDDDGGANTYDYNDSFIDDKGPSLEKENSSENGEEEEEAASGEDGSDFEEDLNGLKKDAKAFQKNKKIVKPARTK